MSAYRLHQQFIRLWQCYQGQSQQITLDELAVLLGCSRRHMRSLLTAMQQQGWLSWQAAAGRGRRSWLNFHYSGISSRPQQLAELLEQDKIDQLRQQLDAEQLLRLLCDHTGYAWLHRLPVLRLLTSTALENLLPGSALNSLERHVVHQVFSGLLRADPLTGDPQPAIAYHWHAISPVHWRFRLRPEIRFHHGRVLDSEDLVNSLQRLSTLAQGAHIQRVQAHDQYTLDIYLHHSDRWLPWLLCSDIAVILPKEWVSMADFSRLPVGCGAYQVIRNTPSSLTLQAFANYFGYRALIDKVSIWSYPAGNEYGVRLRDSDCYADDNSIYGDAKTAGLMACYYLLFDQRQALMCDATCRAWLSQVLSPAVLLGYLPPAWQRLWQIAWHLLPGYRIPGTAPPAAVARPADLQRLTLTFCRDNTDFHLLSQSIATILAQHQVTLECQPVTFACAHQGEITSDIWLNELPLSPPVDFSAFFSLWQTPLLHHCLPTDWQKDASRWQAGTLNVAQWYQQYQSDLLPLFHHPFMPSGWRDFQTTMPPGLLR